MSCVAWTARRYPDSMFVAAGSSPVWADSDAISLSTDGAVAVSTAGSSFEALLSIGVFPVKTVSVLTVSPDEVICCGTPFGIRMKIDGVLVAEVAVPEGSARNPGRDAGLTAGDIIISADGEQLRSADRLSEIFAQGQPVTLQVRRLGETFTTRLIPEYRASEGRYRSGLWVRDSAAGIGTMTFYTPDGGFAGLGHAICDPATGEILPLAGGEITRAVVNSITPGAAGSPGELTGTLLPATIGEMTQNSAAGVYGRLFAPLDGKPILPAMRNEVVTGPAYIMCAPEGGEPRYYEIEIERLHPSDADGKNMVIRVTDPELLELTNGIVQGMSGSPIIQNGKLVGAVTHVFVNYPEKGYGIFADTMLVTLRKTDGAAA